MRRGNHRTSAFSGLQPAEQRCDVAGGRFSDYVPGYFEFLRLPLKLVDDLVRRADQNVGCGGSVHDGQARNPFDEPRQRLITVVGDLHDLDQNL